MFNKKEEISGESPAHVNFIRNVCKPLFESWGYQVIILHSDMDYLDYFNTVIEYPRKHMEHRGIKRGFPCSGKCGIKRDCKLKPIEEFYKSIKEPYVQYVGICKDEPQRLDSLKKDNSKISLLEKYGYTEQMAKRLCEEYGLLSPIYRFSRRGGCWFCPYAKREEHREIREKIPSAWKVFINLENTPGIANNKWNVYGETLHDRDEYLKRYKQLSIFDLLEKEE